MESKNHAVKLRKKDVVNTFRQGGRCIREMLRERCREKIREKRAELYNIRRLGSKDEQENFNNSLAGILRKEFSDLSLMVYNQNNSCSPGSSSGALMPEDNTTDIEDETSEVYQSMVQAYEEMYQLEDDFMNKFIAEMFKDEVICPICQIAPMEESPEGFICQGCELNLPAKLSIGELADSIKEQLNEHNRKCLEQASFAVVPENDNSSLYLICDTCSNFALIM